MKKKGFTLIELLAVIVILAIIALIAIPLVLKYIEKSRKESKVDSAYSFIRNLETQMANYAIKNNGSKFNKSPKNGKFYELGDFEDDKYIDTTVKGESPTGGKVCISSVGQVEKGVFEYDNYYVSYDGKNANVSDKDAFDNFKCDNNNVIFDDNMTFTYNEDLGMHVTNTCLEQIKFKNKSNYRITIDDNEIYEVISVFGKYYGEESFGLAGKYNFVYLQLDNSCMIGSMDGKLDLSKERHLKIEYVGDDVYPQYLTIEPDGLTIFSLELEAGTAVVEIKDNEGNSSIFDVEVDSDEIYDYIDINDYNINSGIKPYYELVKNGGTVTVTVTQGENVYVLGGSEFTFEDDQYCGGELYYWGNNKLGYWFGC